MRGEERESKQALETIILTQELERRRWALEIHDTIIQSLANIYYRLQAYRRLLSRDPDRAGKDLEEMENLIMEAMAEARGIIDDLRPPLLDDMGLIPAIEKYLNRLREEEPLSVSLEVKKPLPRLSSEVETGIYRIVQEALSNVRKHARATQVKVEIIPKDSELMVRVIDNGCGFDLEMVDTEGDNWGLIGMRERAEVIGASLQIESTVGKGTAVCLEVPLETKE